jgi:Helix-turn-helix domain of resolvase
MTNPVGCPSKYKAEYCEQVIELGRQGKSPAQIAAALDVARMTLYLWADAHPEFMAAFTRAKDLAQAWFEDKGQDGLFIPGFNASLWSKQVSSRFREDYTERQEITGKDGKDLLPTEIEIIGISAK